MSLELANHFRILRLEELVRQHQNFKDATFHSPLRIAAGLTVRALARPLRQLMRSAEQRKRTRSSRPPEDMVLTERFLATLDGTVAGNHAIYRATTEASAAGEAMTVPLESGNDRLVFVHAFYEREAEQIFERLELYPNYDLILTTPVPAIRDAFLARFNSARALCIEVPNVGRDILPFLLALRLIDLPRYRYFIKVHTKRSAHLSDGGMWFRLNLHFLLGQRHVSDAFFALLDERKPSLYGVDSLPVQDHLENNRGWMEALLGYKLEQASAQFIPGSMFMGTGALLRGVAAKRFDMYPMEPEAAQLDGTLAHALERYLGCLAQQGGGECLSIESFLTKRGVA